MITDMKLVFHTATDIGKVRTVNQDSLLADEKNKLFIVADGMGGHQGGEVASQLAVQEVLNQLAGKTPENSSIIEEMQQAFQKANTMVFNEGEKNIELRGMGTTLCVFFAANDNTAYIGNVGDSRLYMAKDHKLWQLTEDHSFAAGQIKAAILSGVKDNSMQNSHFLTRSVGFLPTVEPDISVKNLEKGEIYLLCSDGLCGFVANEVIKDILFNCPVEQIPEECVKKALQAGGEDNVSVIAIEIQ